MHDFVNWCHNADLINVFEDGTVAWKSVVEEGKDSNGKGGKFAGGRDARKDLSSDYADPTHDMSNVWPFKVVQKGKGGKAIAPVAK